MSNAAKSYTISEVLSLGEVSTGRWKGEQRGSLERRKTGWFGRWREFQLRDDNTVVWSQVTRKLCGPEDGKAEAIRILNENVTQAGGPAACHQGIATLSQFITARFESDHVAHLKASGKKHYKWCFTHIMPALGGFRMKEFTPSMVQQFLNAMSKKMGAQSVRHLRNAISAVFGHAKACGFWRGDLPTEYVRTPEVHAVKPKALTEEQVAAVLANMKEPYRTVALVIATTGLRIGEALALCWDMVDLDRRFVRVRRNFTHGAWGTVKSRAGLRDLALSEHCVMALETLRVPLAAGWLVFPNQHGRPLDAHNMGTRHLGPACKAAGIAPIGWHALRHTAITLMREKGLLDHEAQIFAGHASREMTDNYTHPAIERMRSAVEKMDYFGETKGQVM